MKHKKRFSMKRGRLRKRSKKTITAKMMKMTLFKRKKKFGGTILLDNFLSVLGISFTQLKIKER